MSVPPPLDPRTPLDAGLLAAELERRGARLRAVALLGATESTNADAAALIAAGRALPFAVASEVQTAGRGRLGRVWEAPAGSSLMVSFAVDPGVAVGAWTWLPLLAGLAAVRAVEGVAGLEVGLKWPNDVVAGPPAALRKLGGILVEAHGSGAVIGIGLNVDQEAHELPVATATSLRLEGASSDRREPLLAELAAQLERLVGRLATARGNAEAAGLAAEYRVHCRTLGQRVRVLLPGGGELVGEAVGLAHDGALEVAGAEGATRVSAGDIVHLRPA